MTTFPVHSSETAPEGSKPVLAAAHKKFGFVPNLFRVMAAIHPPAFQSEKL